MQAPRVETQILPPPPGIFGSLRTGFDAIAAHVSVILVPLALDLLLWLGPRLSMEGIGKQALPWYVTWATALGAKPEDIQANLTSLGKFFEVANVAASLRTFPIGIFSLMNWVRPTQTPWGTPAMIQISSWPGLVGLIFLLTIVGWILGGLYFRWVALLSTPDTLPETRPSTGAVIANTLVYAVICLIFFGVVGIPLMFLLQALLMINAILAEGVLLLLGFTSIWLLVPLFFSPHGFFLRRQNAFASILSAFQMSRFTLPTSSLFVLTVLLLAVGLNFLWAQPANNSWLMLVGICGHAFITTALLASTFVYYHNMTSWLQVALARLRSGLPGQQI